MDERAIAALGLRVLHAWRPRPSPHVSGCEHLVTDKPIAVGRIKRKAGDVLCRPNRRFWDLSPGHYKTPDCPRCIAIAKRLTPEPARA